MTALTTASGIPAAMILKDWRENPVKCVYDNFKVEPDAWQVEGLESFAHPDPKRRISFQACVGPGKTALLAWCGWMFLSLYSEKDHHPKGLAVSVTKDNLKDNLWPELAHWQARAEWLVREFEWTAERISHRRHKEDWFLGARSWSKKSNSQEQGRTLSGLHAKRLLVLVDESGEIPESVIQAGEQAFSSTSTEWIRMMQAGNPSSLEGVLYAAATKLKHLWHVIRITGDPDDPKRSPRIDIAWARDQIATHGRDNPWVMYSILGLFPPASINALLGIEDIEAAMSRQLRPSDYENVQKRLGIDPARFGDDRTVIAARQGLNGAIKPVIMRNQDGPQIAARVALARSRFMSEMQMVDDTGGYGASVIDQLRMAGIDTLAVNSAGKATDPRFWNKRAECYWEAAQWVKRGGALPRMDELPREAIAATYTYKDGKILIEPKDQIKKRLGYSPDIWDAYTLTFALPDMPAAMDLGVPMPDDPRIALRQRRARHDVLNDPSYDMGGMSRMLSEYDPLGGT